MRKLAFRIVNVFVESDAATFGGNPLAVFEEGRDLTDATMQAIAAQFNLSETTFIVPRSDAPPLVRIFTPRYELPFAGHPTIGTAQVIASLGEAANPSAKLARLTLSMKAGNIEVERENGGWTFTANAHRSRKIDVSPKQLAQALGLAESDLDGDARFVSTGTEQLVVSVRSAQALARVAPSPELLQQHFQNDAGRYMVYLVLRLGPDCFQVRFFFPTASGMSEDPGTGSACANLGGFLLDRGERAPAHLMVTQGEFIDRRNLLQLSLTAEKRIRVGGRCVEVGRGEFAIA